MATGTQIKTIREQIEKSLAILQKDLIRRPQWGEITFEKAEADLQRAKDVITYLNELPIDVLPDSVVTNTINMLNNLLPILTQIDGFTLNSAGAPGAQRDSLSGQLHLQVDSVYNVIGLWIPFLAYKKGDIAENVGKLSKAVAEAQEALNKAKLTVTSKYAEIDEIISAARTASASAGAAVFTDDFLAEAREQEKMAKTWLVAAGLIAVLSIVAAAAMWFFAYKSSPLFTTIQLVQVVAAKLVILSILIGVATWCGGIYKALRHQMTMNKHRALSLRTLQAFSKAASDEQTKNAVLAEACRAVFVGGVTGYLDGKAGVDDSSLKVIEVAKTLSGKGMN